LRVKNYKNYCGDDDDDESGDVIGRDGVLAEPGGGEEDGAEGDDSGAAAWADGSDGPGEPAVQPLAQTLKLVLQLCMQVVQYCVWFVTLYCR
jgi:hypothetical protein